VENMKPNSISQNKNDGGRQHKWITRTAFIFAAFGLLASVRSAQITPVPLPPNVFAVTTMTGSPAPFENEFCWRDSYGRSAGEMPGRVADCPPGYTNNGATCGRGADTILVGSEVADCPAGYKNMGLTCYRGLIHTATAAKDIVNRDTRTMAAPVEEERALWARAAWSVPLDTIRARLPSAASRIVPPATRTRARHVSSRRRLWVWAPCPAMRMR